MADAAASPPDPAALLRSKQFLALLVVASLVGVAVAYLLTLALSERLAPEREGERPAAEVTPQPVPSAI